MGIGIMVMFGPERDDLWMDGFQPESVSSAIYDAALKESKLAGAHKADVDASEAANLTSDATFRAQVVAWREACKSLAPVSA